MKKRAEKERRVKKRAEKERRVKKRAERERRVKKSVKHARKKFVYKLVLVLWIILLFVVLFFLIVFVLEKISEKFPEKEKELGGELKTFGIGGLDEATRIYFPENCAIENLTETWKSIFLESEAGVIFIHDEDCKHYLMYKQISLVNRFYYCIIYGENFESSNELGLLQYVYGMCGNLYPLAYSELILINSGNVGTTSTENFFLRIYEKVSGRTDVIDSETEAEAKFSERFRPESGTWHKNNTDLGWSCIGGECYLFNSTMFGGVYTELFLDALFAGISSPNECTDSDGGLNYYAKGYVNNSLNIIFEDYCLNSSDLIESYCVPSDPNNFKLQYTCPNGCKDGKCTSIPGNTPPTFIPENCSSIMFEVNTNYTLNMEDCFYDEEGNTLTFNYTEMDINNISITRESNYLTFLPNVNFTGNGSFYIFANDSINETKSDEIKVEVSEKKIVVESCTDEDAGKNKTVASTTANSTYSVTDYCDINGSLIEYYCNGTSVESEKISCGVDYSCDEGACTLNSSSVTPEIVNSTPQGKKVSMLSNESMVFTISAKNYDSIKWYLDDELVDRDVNSYTISDLEEGNHTLKVEATKGDKVISKTWDLIISKEEAPKRSYLVYFVISFVILGLLAIFIIFLIIRGVLEKKEEKRGPIIQLAPQQKPESTQIQGTFDKTDTKGH